MAELAGDRARRTARAREQRIREEVRMWRNFAALARFATPRLPVEVLMCFDAEQRQIRPLPAQMRERTRAAPFIPAQRSAPPGVPTKPRTQWGSR